MNCPLQPCSAIAKAWLVRQVGNVIGKSIAGVLLGWGLAMTALHADETPVIRVQMIRAKIPYGIAVEKADCQSILRELPEVKLVLNKENILKQLTKDLESYELVLLGDHTRESIAVEIYEKTVLPFLKPRLEKINETINQTAIRGEKISAGVLLFPGLCEGMDDVSSGQSTQLNLIGSYTYQEGHFQEGGAWEFDRCQMLGTTGMTRHAKAAIDETLKCSLAAYGVDQELPLTFKCEGKVQLEKKFVLPCISPENPKGKPRTIVTFRPEVHLIASKIFEQGNFFTVVGAEDREKTKIIKYPATLTVALDAEDAEHKW